MTCAETCRLRVGHRATRVRESDTNSRRSDGCRLSGSDANARAQSLDLGGGMLTLASDPSAGIDVAAIQLSRVGPEVAPVMGLIVRRARAGMLLDERSGVEYAETSLRQQRTGVRAGKVPWRTTATVRFFYVRTPCAFNGRALVGVRLRTPVPTDAGLSTPLCARPPRLRAGAGSYDLSVEAASCALSPLAPSNRNSPSKSFVLRFAPPRSRPAMPLRSMRPAKRCAALPSWPAPRCAMDNRQHAIPTDSIDKAVIRLDELAAFANLLSSEEALAAFSQLDRGEQVSIFGALEGMANAARAALTQGAGVLHD